MGLFDDFTNFVNEAQSLREEATQLGSDIVKDLSAGASEVKKTVTDTTDAVKSAISADTSQEQDTTTSDVR